MRLTPEQREAANCPHNALVVACPGSGKTHTLAAKLLASLEDVRGTPRRIACITYTNAGVDEIEARLRRYGRTGDHDLCHVSTIHSFCLDNILNCFHWRLPAFRDGFRVLPPDSEQYVQIVSQVRESQGLKGRVAEAFELLGREPGGQPILPQGLTASAASEFWQHLLDIHSVDFANIIYFSYRLMVEWPGVARAVASRYAWILVDEFQDTSALQVEILKLIAAEDRTRFFLVGDPQQSIYSFAGARPELMDEFADHVAAHRGFSLLTNFRSSKPIVKHAERLCPRTPPMESGGPAALFTGEPSIIAVPSPSEAIIDHFVPALDHQEIAYGNAAILAPSWFKLLPLGRALRDHGIPIVGPGSRPYKRSSLFARLAEEICCYTGRPDPSALPRIERELSNAITQATGSRDFRIHTYEGRKTVLRLIGTGDAIRRENEGAIPWLGRAAAEFTTILTDDGFLPPSCAHLLPESVVEMHREMVRRGADVASLSVADLGLFGDAAGSIRLLTMHAAKGREFDAVALIGLHEGEMPSSYAQTQGQIEEARRLLYVSVTRARRLLMYVLDCEKRKNCPTRFLGAQGLCLLDHDGPIVDLLPP